MFSNRDRWEFNHDFPDSDDYSYYGSENSEIDDGDEDSYGYDEGDEDGGYGVDPHEYARANAYGDLHSRRRDDDETSSQSSAKRRGYPLENTQIGSYKSALNSAFKLDGLKQLLIFSKLPKSGRKQDLVDRLAGHFEVLYNAQNATEFNRLVTEMNRIMEDYRYGNPRRGYHRWVIDFYPDLEALKRFKDSSKRHEFKIPTPNAYKITRVISEPLYLRNAPKTTANNLELSFDYLPNFSMQQDRPFLALLILRMSDDFKEGLDPEKINFRFSFGNRLSRLSFNSAYLVRPTQRPGGMIYAPITNPRAGKNTIRFAMNKNRFPNYYLQVVELIYDPNIMTTLSAMAVKKEYLERVAKSDVQTSTLQLSLRCPLSLIRMTVPVRFETCKHLQCMELSAWQQYSSNITYGKPNCPVCNRPGDQLITDDFTLEILKAVPESVDSVTLDVEKDLAWSIEKPGSTSTCAPGSLVVSEPASEVGAEEEIFCIDLTEDNTVYDSPWPIKPEPALPAEALKFTQAPPATTPAAMPSANLSLVDLSALEEAIERRLATQRAEPIIIELD